MGLFELVQQHHLPWTASDGFGKHATFFIADVAWRRSDQPRHVEALHVLAAVHTNEGMAILEEKLRQRLGQLCLAHTCRTQEQEGPERPLMLVQPSPRDADAVTHRLDGLRLPHHPLLQLALHPKQPLPLIRHQVCQRNTRHGGYHLGNLICRHCVRHHACPVCTCARLCCLLLQRGDLTIPKLRHLAPVTSSHRTLHLTPRLVQPYLGKLGALQLLALLVPLGLQRSPLPLRHLQLRHQLPSALLRRCIRLTAQSLQFDALRGHRTIQCLQRRWLALLLQPQHGSCLVHQVHSLVRHLALREVAVGQHRCVHERTIRDADPMMHLVLLLQASEDGHRRGHIWLFHDHRLEPSRQRRVFLNVLAVFGQRGRAHTPQLAACQHWLQQIRCIHGALCSSCAHEHVHLVDEQDDAAVACLDVRQHLLQTFLELATELGTRHQCPEVQRHHTLVLHAVRDLSGHDALRQAFHHRRLTDACLTSQSDRVLGPPGQNLDRSTDLFPAPDHRIQLALLCQRGQILAVFLESLTAHARIWMHPRL
mmetsp:Transcript_19693/g.62550  ORF Transcript_19693/g.62550 Transcript_19693/m.62550 type:complete len:537 (+) Transcript_19693:715-2325(+)